MRISLRLLVLAVWLGLASWAAQASEPSRPASTCASDALLVRPYLQLGDAPAHGTVDGLALVWHTDDHEADWQVEYRAESSAPWRKLAPPSARKVAVAGVAPHRVYRATLEHLPPGGTFEYRLSRSGEPVFHASGRAPKGADQPYRFVAFGDCGAGTAAQKAVAYRASRAQPDFVMIAGDIVYSRGRVSEYRTKFWPVYNADTASPTVGAPLLRSTLFVAAPGNHDIATRDFAAYPDGLAYFLYWDQPLNGPGPHAPAGIRTPEMKGPEANVRAFLDAAGPAFPRMANFSFDYGNAHWTMLDANPYVDWTDAELRAWVERDLAAASGATWRFVCFHHPGFNSSKNHFNEQRMRRLAEVFEAGAVDLVFTGHVHNYQRSYPLYFKPAPSSDTTKGRVDGRWTLDRSYDGKSNTRPQGVIYLVSGAGGASLYNPEQHDDPASWQEFTCKFNSKTHSLTVADVNGRTLTVRQVSAGGDEIDRFVVTK